MPPMVRKALRAGTFSSSVLVLSMLASCKSPPSPPAETVPSTPSAPVSVAASAPPPTVAGPCEGAPCEVFPSAEAAVQKLLDTKPRIMAFGESHAQKDGPKLPSTTKRFTEGMLPLFKGKATDLLIELWVANGSCGKATEQKVATQQKAVAAPQAETNQNEFVTLGNVAKGLGVRPHVLVPPCDEYAKILDAGAGDVDAMLQMIARLTANDMRTFLEKTEGKESLLLAYGGALHNDVTPKKGHEAWSFGPEMEKKLGAKYMEIDLVAPEGIRDTPAWQGLAWYGKYKPERHTQGAVLMTLGPSSYAVFLPKSAPVP